MASIIFLRHGQAQNNTMRVLSGRTPGIKLTESGVEQAKHAAGLISNMNISRIYTSPIDRAAHTAEIVSDHNSVEVVSDERLTELDMGKFTGMKYDDIMSAHGNVFLKFYSGDLELAHNGVETFDEVKKRIRGMIAHVTEHHPGENILLVTHMDPIKAMLSTVLDLNPKPLSDLVVANASLTVFDANAGSLALRAINIMEPSRFNQDW